MNNNSNHDALGGIAKAALVLACIGAVNWGLIGFFNFNLVDAILGGGTAEETSSVSRIVYSLVGLAGLVGLLLLPKLHASSRRSESGELVSQMR